MGQSKHRIDQKKMKRQLFIIYLFLACTLGLSAQEINNLVHPENHKAGEWGKLGEVKEFGEGEQSMILLPGWGFDWSIFKGFIEKYKDSYKIYAVTIPGFGDTSAPPMPEDTNNFKDLYWTKGVVKSVYDLIQDQNLDDPIIVSYFTYSNIIAMRLALDYPENIGRLIILSGMAKFTANHPSLEPRSLDQRIYYIENILAQRWFKTVDKATWDNGNFHAAAFTKDSTIAANYWEQMSAVPIPTMVRYLCEYYCTDLSLEYSKLQVPTLVVIPSFTDDVLHKKETSYLAPFFHHSWLGARPANEKLSLITLTDTNAFIVDDQPEKLYQLIGEFLNDKINQYQVIR